MTVVIKSIWFEFANSVSPSQYTYDFFIRFKEGTSSKASFILNSYALIVNEYFDNLKVTRMFWTEGEVNGSRDGSTIPAMFRISGFML